MTSDRRPSISLSHSPEGTFRQSAGPGGGFLPSGEMRPKGNRYATASQWEIQPRLESGREQQQGGPSPSALVSLRDLMSEKMQQSGGRPTDISGGKGGGGGAIVSEGRRILKAMISGRGWYISPCSSPSFVGPLTLAAGAFDSDDYNHNVSELGLNGSASGSRPPGNPDYASESVGFPWERTLLNDRGATLVEDSILLKAVLELRVGDSSKGSDSKGDAKDDGVGEAGEGAGDSPQVGLSMGQQQLLCLARMLLQRRQFVLLDECTASIDPATSAIMRRVRVCECVFGSWL